ncbi:MAG: hypothetical protein K1X82_10275 [Bacteroidia bacterium]|nr:hypothetical protein [Bacteroidia bacterium]
MEFSIFRNLSISFGYQFFESDKVGQRIKKDMKFNSDLVGLGNTVSVPSSFDEKAYVKASTFYYILKFYPNRMLPAPRGFYLYWQNGYGKANVSGIGVNDTDGPYHFVEYKVPVMTYGFGLGRQFFLNHFVSLDLSLGFSGALMKEIGTGSQFNTSLVAPYWGSNLFSFTAIKKLPLVNDYSNNYVLSSSDITRKNDSFGMDFRIKLGFLLF